MKVTLYLSQNKVKINICIKFKLFRYLLNGGRLEAINLIEKVIKKVNDVIAAGTREVAREREQ